MVDRDFADEQVKGLERFLPSQLSRYLLAALIGTPISVFLVVRGNMEWFSLQTHTPIQQTLLAVLFALLSALPISLALILQLVTIIYQSKHRRHIHENYVSPYMSFKMLYANAAFKHWSALVLFGIVCMAIGYSIALIT